jgi:formylglycine-generating enzyme required for sulfatase activity
MTTPADVRYKAVQASWVQARMEEAGNALNVLILDACRDNPFASDKRSGQRGLAAMQAGTETLIAFAALPGQVAADGQGRNSPYTKHLVQQLARPGLQVEEVFKRVRDAVVQETSGKQRPQEWTTLTKEFRFVERPSAPSQPQSEGVVVRDPEEAMWRLVEQSTNPDDVKHFLREYPKGRFAPAARLKLAQVERQPAPAGGPQVAVGSDPPPEPSTASRTWRNTLGIEFVLIQPGEFLMGSNSGFDDEKPPHQVRISKPFYLGQYEVTQGQWQAVMGRNPSSLAGEATLPVENVSWEDVQEFVRRLNAKEGGPKYRLPTEAEWEYAARAGTSTAYSFGDSERQLGEYAWYYDNSGIKTHPVGQKKPNAWGLYDMHGNVEEWVQDWYGPYKAGAAVDPAGPSSGSSRVSRGGGRTIARYCRSAIRRSYPPGSRDGGVLGFRLLREVQ